MAALALLALALCIQAQDEAAAGDACLRDLCFSDARQGWAAGDRGVIWHTDDAGRSWQLQDSGVTCPLRSICFLDAARGWAAGGLAHPYTHGSSGVVLWTRDGGRTWRHDPRLTLPTLERLRMFDHQRGWAAGNSSPLFPSGVFLTRDGGQSWMPIGGAGAAGWTSGDFLDPHTGLLTGRDGTTAAVRQGDFEAGQAASPGLQTLRTVRFFTPAAAWLAGDGGLLLGSFDQGARWRPPPESFPRDTAELMDFSALAVRGPKCWIAGTPGSRVIHSPDAGRSWTVFPTPTALPLSALTFADDRHGWAVGALGTIIASDDGGRTWRRQRGAGRAALLALCCQADELPLELFAKLGGGDGYLCAAEVLCRRDVEVAAGDEAHLSQRLEEAIAAGGGSDARAAWQFPLRQAGLQLSPAQVSAGWDRFHAGRGGAELAAHLVRQIRLWRPEVIVTHAPAAGPGGDDAAEQLVAAAVARAVAEAADRNCCPRQLVLTGLEPWQAKKVYGLLPAGARGGITLTTSQWLPRLGHSLADAATPARGLLADRFTAPAAALNFRLLADPLGQGEAHGDFFTGIPLPPGGEARRPSSGVTADGAAENIGSLERLGQRRRHVQALLDQARRNPQTALRLLAQTGDLTRGLDAAGAAAILYQLGDGYAQTGHGDLAAETFQSLADQYPDEPLCRPALIWLLQYFGSEEEAERAGEAGPASAAPGEPRLPALPGAVVPSSRLQRAVALAGKIERTRPDLFASPAARFPAAAAYRREGMTEQARRLYSLQTGGGPRDAWRACAQGELWLLRPKGPSPRPAASCVATTEPPRLDGRLDDAAWRRAKPLVLQSPLHEDAQWPASVMLAHDAEFLYLAIRCRRAPGARYEAAPPGPRPRDADLAAHDRVDLLLDLDRDYATYYRLTIDHRGWTHDACTGDDTWDPTWYVAARGEPGEWTAEAAIPLRQLSRQVPGPRTVWALGVQRTIPGVGFQSWTAPAATAIAPEGFGHLVFE